MAKLYNSDDITRVSGCVCVFLHFKLILTVCISLIYSVQCLPRERVKFIKNLLKVPYNTRNS